MAELLPDRLGSAGMTAGEDQTRVPRSRRKAVTNIFEWVKCFAIYVAVLSRSYRFSYVRPYRFSNYRYTCIFNQ